jgi:hypothetical protein
MWDTYVRFCDWMMAKEDPEDPFSYRAITAEEFAELTILLPTFCGILYSWFVMTYCYH